MDLNSKKQSLYSSDRYLDLHNLEGNSDRIKKVINIISQHKGKRLLDIGCGTGNITVKLKDFIDEIHAIEISGRAVKAAKEKGVNASQLDIDEKNLPFNNNFFDIIFCGELIEHVFDPDHLLDEIYRTLKPKGIAVITTPNLANYLNRLTLLFGFHPYFTSTGLRYNTGKFFGKGYPCPHITVFALRSLKELLRLHNFQIKKIIGANAYYLLPQPVRILDAIVTRIPSLATCLIFVVEKKI